MLSRESYIYVGEHAGTFSSLYVKSEEASEVRKFLGAWELLETYLQMATFPSHILYHVSAFFRDDKVLKMTRIIPAHQWSRKRRVGLSIYHTPPLLGVHCGVRVIFPKSCAIQYKDAAKSAIAGHPMRPEEAIEYYYVSLFYSNQCGKRQL